ncbi:hypothetical protein [Diaphorobacter aerolatus]|uniref:Uncharacterized protein n=1 Tax=Diaphorobacter aerolatus TaxID=1288495 RepID=A0A7H0GJA1_9BURK|nr:hypothetical protein [Diaphorobacter aerolatus]QNP48367.1 hypothetical protein H9K75_20830 [Diaphorobacter aerolatus]
MLKIQEINLDGIEVWTEPEHNRAVISTPNNFDIYWSLSRKDENGVPYAERHGSEDPSRAYFTIPLDKLNTDNKVRDFNQKMISARSTSKEIQNEHEDFKYTVAFDHSNGATPCFKYRLPESGYTTGKVVHAGKFFAVLEQGERDGNRYFQVVKTNAVLQGRDEFLNREDAVKKHFPMGEMRYMSVGPTGRVSVSEYQPTQQREQAPEQSRTLPFNRTQKDALMAFAEHFGEDWKGILISNWNVARYPQVPPHDAKILDGMRESLGVQGLLQMKTKDLFLGTPSDEVAQPQRQAPIQQRQPKTQPKFNRSMS